MKPLLLLPLLAVSQVLLGWKYEEAFEESQKYKEGKFILEKTKISRDDEGT